MKFLSVFMSVLMAFSVAFSAPAKQLGPVVITPSTLRKELLSRNIGIAISLNDVQQAKAQVAQARGNLLPSVNLGSLISSGPIFMLTSVSMLLPFLMPSNWMNLRESTWLLRAQATSHYLAELNAYASAYSLYYTILGDMQLRESIYHQYQNLRAIEEELRIPADMGTVRMEEYLQAQAQAEMAFIQVSQLDEVIKTERAAIRKMLGLDLSQEISFVPVAISASSVEGQLPQDLIEQVHKNSPETVQMSHMITAAQYATWSKGFSFLSGASLGMSRSVDGGAFSSVTRNGSVNLGFGYFPALELSNLNVQQLQLRKKELRLEQAQVLEVAFGALEEAHKQHEAAQKAHLNLEQVYEAEYFRYKMGLTDILHVLQAANSLSSALVNKVKAETALNTLRVTLHRTMITDEFSQIQPCEIERRSSGGIRGKLGRIFNPDKDNVTLDQVCGR
ncbi:MAG: TolC family protein [Bdellovibrio sp.]